MNGATWAILAFIVLGLAAVWIIARNERIERKDEIRRIRK